MAYFIRKNDKGQDVYGLDFEIEVKECKQADDGKRTVSMVGSTPSVDRDGDTIKQSGWDTKAFKTNPVILWGHDHSIPAIGRANKFKKNSESLTFDEIEFPQEGVHKFADMIFSLMEGGFIKAGSVGFIPIEMDKRKVEEDEPGNHYYPVEFKKQELLEFSIVNVPSNRDALVTHLSAKGFQTTGKVKINDQEFEMKQLIDAMFVEDKEDKTVIPFKHYPLAGEDTKWSGPKEIREADIPDLELMSTWFDSENPEVKGSYKLPHHQASDKHTVWNGVRAAMGALLGARGGVDIPEGDRKRVFNHLSKHYKEFDKDVPEFKAYEESELKEIFPGLFKEKEVIETTVIARYCAVVDEKETFTDVLLEKSEGTDTWNLDVSKAPGSWDSMKFITTTGADWDLTTCINISEDKAGAVLSKGNKTKLRNAATAINDVLASAEPAPEDGGQPSDDKQKPPKVEVDIKSLADEVGSLAKIVQDLVALKKQVVKKPVKEDNQDDIDLGSIDVESKKEGDIVGLEDIDVDKFAEQLDGILTSKVSTIVSEEFNRVTGKLN